MVFNVSFSPQRSDEKLTLCKQGNILIVNGREYDFTDMPDGSTLPKEAFGSNYFIGNVDRSGDKISVKILLPYGAGSPSSVLYPSPINISDDGEVRVYND